MAEPLDGGIQTVLEVYERIGWPELVSELISRDQFPRSLEQHGKNLNRLPLHLNLAAILAKFTRPEIEFETLEMDGTRGRRWLAHAPSLCSQEVVDMRGKDRDPIPDTIG